MSDKNLNEGADTTLEGDIAELERAPGGIMLTTVDALIDWSRGQSLWAFPMGTACCAIELIAASFNKFDFDRLGTFPRPDPRHCDVMVLAGTITEKMKPAVLRLYEQMPEPKWVVAMGNCTVSGGIFFYDTYSVVRGADSFLPVDVYICGCPPRPESLQDGIIRLRELVHTDSLAKGRRYHRELTLPTVGEPPVQRHDRGAIPATSPEPEGGDAS